MEYFGSTMSCQGLIRFAIAIWPNFLLISVVQK
jgi:hypothetical protein